jgi:hypothetical protein
MCHGGCGVLVYVENGKVVKIKGDPESPLNRGRICPKGMASIELLYHPDRLKYPLKRAGKRGEEMGTDLGGGPEHASLQDRRHQGGLWSESPAWSRHRWYYFMSVLDLPMP